MSYVRSAQDSQTEHKVVDFPDELRSTFESKEVTSDIAGNFPGVSIIKDPVSSTLHVFGSNIRAVEDAEHHLRNFIADICIQKIYAEAPVEPDEIINGVVNYSQASASNEAEVFLEVELKEVVVDISEKEVRDSLQWMNFDSMICPKDEHDFLTRKIYILFKNRNLSQLARTNLAEFYPAYSVRQVSRFDFDQAAALCNRKPNSKNNLINSSDPVALNEYFDRLESDNTADAKKFKKESASRLDILKQNKDGMHTESPPLTIDLTDSPIANTDNKIPYKHNLGTSGVGNRHPKATSSGFQNQPNTAGFTSPSPFAELERRPVAIDASNVCMHHGGHKVYSCRGLELAVNYFLEKGHTEVYAFIPEMKIRGNPYQNPRIERQDILRKLEAERHLTIVPHRKIGSGQRIIPYDDVMIAQYAYEKKGVVVSNDNMIDVARDYPEYRDVIENWRITFSFAGDTFLPVTDPNGRNGLRVEEMLVNYDWS